MYFLAMAFIMVWLAVTLYVVYMVRRQRQLEEELATLREFLIEQKD